MRETTCYFATWAAAYVGRLQNGDRRPIQTLAHHPPVRFRGQRRLSVNTVRGIIAEARDRELLSSPPAGKAGGELTGKAIGLLDT